MINMFEMGQVVIDVTGNVGMVLRTCNCSECEKRGFADTEVVMADDSIVWITHHDYVNNFNQFYTIGDGTVYPEHVNKFELNSLIEKMTIEVTKLNGRIDRAKRLLSIV